MKKHLKTIAIAALMTAALVGCKKKDDSSTPAPGANTITGNITSDATWKASEQYALGGYVYVKSGATLTIEAGTVIKSSKIQSALIVEPGGKIIAQGTPSNPIVFTSGTSNPRRGDWAGIVICG
ncbi:MAG TPA: hypothetical protein VK796_08950, partial [Cytophaga sp.]|nr:hypothetical protein [Cytophaga sp.]